MPLGNSLLRPAPPLPVDTALVAAACVDVVGGGGGATDVVVGGGGGGGEVELVVDCCW